MERIISLVIGYCFGLIQTAYLYGRMNHIDIRQHGSGNAGTTNALRVLGKKAGLIVFLGDVLKTIAACVAARLLFGRSHPELAVLYSLYGGLGAVLGHNYPFYMKFKGGKGIAAMAGILIALDWRITLTCLVIFVVTVAVTRYVSLGSLLVVTVFFIEALFFSSRGDYGDMGKQIYEFYILAFILTALPYFKHRANIGRLLKGTENKLGAKKSE